MLSHNIAPKQANKDDGQSMDGGGGGGGGNDDGRNTQNTPLLKPPEQIVKCPRCDSSNTKFCYYNNYSLAQPRHFCKTCRRYWTKGGALRNVPIGGNCRKSKKTKSSKSSSSDIGGMKFFGLSSLDFQLGGLNFPPRVTTPNQFSSSYANTSNNHSLPNLDPLGYNLPFLSPQNNQNREEIRTFHEVGVSVSNHLHHNDLASSIQSLSSINQDLHWKLQQQRLAMLFGDGGNGDYGRQKQKEQVVLDHPQDQKLQPILFQNLETLKPAQTNSLDGDSRKETNCGLATELYFDSSYAHVNPATSTNSINGAGGNDQNGSMNNWNGIQAWNHVNQYS